MQDCEEIRQSFAVIKTLVLKREYCEIEDVARNPTEYLLRPSPKGANLDSHYTIRTNTQEREIHHP